MKTLAEQWLDDVFWEERCHDLSEDELMQQLAAALKKADDENDDAPVS